jgi:hypothetical protein
MIAQRMIPHKEEAMFRVAPSHPDGTLVKMITWPPRHPLDPLHPVGGTFDGLVRESVLEVASPTSGGKPLMGPGRARPLPRRIPPEDLHRRPMSDRQFSIVIHPFLVQAHSNPRCPFQLLTRLYTQTLQIEVLFGLSWPSHRSTSLRLPEQRPCRRNHYPAGGSAPDQF